MARGLLDLPVELIEAVAEQLLGDESALQEVANARPTPRKELPIYQSYLQYHLENNEELKEWYSSRQAFLQFRLVSRKIKDSVWRLFCCHYLATLRVMVTEDAFQGLIDWSNDPVVSPEVKAISISMSSLAGAKNDTSLRLTLDVIRRRIEDSGPDSMKRAEELYQIYERRVVQHCHYVTSNSPCNMLAEALRGFKNCREISISDDRLRWTSHYPAKKLMREDDVGMELVRASGNTLGLRLSHLFRLTMEAIELSMARIESLRVDLTHSTYIQTFALWPEAFRAANSTRAVLANLRSLQVELDPRSSIARSSEWVESFARGFLQHCVNLQELNLGFLERKECAGVLHELAAADITLPSLQTLQLRHVRGCAHSLVTFIKRFMASLRKLILLDCRAKKCDCNPCYYNYRGPSKRFDIFGALKSLVQDGMPVAHAELDACRNEEDNGLILWEYPERYDDDGRGILLEGTAGRRVY